MADQGQTETPVTSEKVTYESLLGNKDLMDSMYHVLHDLGDKDVEYEPKAILDTFLTRKRFFDTNILSTVLTGNKMKEMDDEGKVLLNYALTEVDKLPSFYEKGGSPAGAALADYLLAGVSDPTNLMTGVAAAFTLGAGGAAALASRGAAQQGVKELVKAKLKAAVSKSVLKSLAVEGTLAGLGGSAQNYYKQDVEKDIGMREEFDPYEMAAQGILEGTLSPAIGIVGNILGSAAIKTGKDVFDNIPAVHNAANWIERNFLPSANIGETSRRLTERRIGEVNSLQDRAFNIKEMFDTAAKKEALDLTNVNTLDLVNKAIENDPVSISQLAAVAPETAAIIPEFRNLVSEASQYSVTSKLPLGIRSIFGNNSNYTRNVPEAYFLFKRESFDDFLSRNPNVIQDYKAALIANFNLPKSQRYPGFEDVTNKFINPRGQVTLPADRVDKIILDEIKSVYEPTRIRRVDTGPLGQQIPVPDVVKTIIGYNNKPALRIVDTINGIVSMASRVNLAHDIGTDAVRKNLGVVANSLADANAMSPTGRDLVPLISKPGITKYGSPFHIPDDYVDQSLKKIFVDPEYAKQLKELFDDTPFFNSALADTTLGNAYKVVLGVQNFAKAGKTIYNPISHIRNTLGAAGYAGVSGNFKSLFDTAQGMKAWNDRFISNEWQEFVRHGLSGGNVNLNQALKRIKDVVGAGDETALASKIMYMGKPGKFAREIYQASDDIAKFLIYQNEKVKAQKILDAFSPVDQQNLLRQFDIDYNLGGAATRQDYINEQAAINTSNITPIYDRIPKFLEKMRVLPVIGSFMAYPAERIRNTYNILKLSTDEMNRGFKTGNKELTKSGVARLAQWYVGQGSWYTAAYSLNEYLGHSDIVDTLRNTILPEYKKDNAIVVTKVDKDGNPYIIDLSYINPDQGIVGAVVPMMMKAARGEDVSKDLDKAVFDSAKNFLKPFISPSLVVNAATNLAEVAKGDFSKLGPLSKILEPGFVTIARDMVLDSGMLDNVNSTLYNIDKFYNPRIYGEVPERATGLLDLLKMNGLVFPGMKEEKIDLKKFSGYTLRELSKNSRENWSDFHRDITSSLTDPTSVIDPTSIANKYNEALADQHVFQQGLVKLHTDLSKLVGTEKTRQMLNSFDLGNAVPSKRDLSSVFDGYARPNILSNDRDYWKNVNKSLVQKTGKDYSRELERLRELLRSVEKHHVGRNLAKDPVELDIK